MKKRTIKIIIACLIVALTGTGAFVAVKHFTKAKQTITTSSYTMSTVKKTNLSKTVDGTGTAYSNKTATLTSKNSGTVKKLTVSVGDKVSKGDVIAKVYDSSLEDTLTQAEENLKTQRLKLSELETELKEAKAAKSTSSSSTTSSNANTNTSTPSGTNAQSNTQGSSSGSTSSSTSSSSTSNNTSSVASIKNEIAQQEITITQAKRTVENAEDAIDKMTVKATISGTITAVSVSKGDTVQNGASLATITNTNSIRVKTSVDELDISSVKKGQSASITFDAIDGKTYKGTVKEIAQNGTTSNSVTTYAVVVSVDNPSKVKLDMNATVTISIQSKKNALVVPADAVTESGGKKYVRVATTSSTANSNNSSSSSKRQNPFSTTSGKLVEVKTGMETEDYIEIKSGLSEGQQVLISMPKSSTSTTTQQGMGGRMGGGMSGGDAPSGGAPSGGPGGGGSSSGGNSK